jgi:hypothetical protein
MMRGAARLTRGHPLIHPLPLVAACRLRSESIQAGLVLHQIPHDARRGVRLRPLAQRQPRVPPWLALRALGILPHHEPVEKHIRWEPLRESGTGGQ